MTRVDFYTLAEGKTAFAARLSHKIHQQGRRVLIYTTDAQATEELDHLLWAAPATGFLPHCRADHPLAAVTPVLLDHAPEAFPHDDVLLNLHPDWPPFFSRFQRLVELVTEDAEDKRRARERYRFYRDRGYEIHTHAVGATG